MPYTINKIADILQAKLIINDSKSLQINTLLIDSRKAFSPLNSLFFAIVGERHDGHDYIVDLIAKGLKNFVISGSKHASPHANFLIVDDTLNALQILAAHHRRQFELPVIGITGSNGKTVVKEWLFSLLSVGKNVVRSPKSYNSQVGVPLSVWQIEHGYDIGLFEAGISKPNEMANLEAIIKPTIGIFTNIGQAHSEGFTSIQEKANEKAKLFLSSKTIIYCANYPEIATALNTDQFKNHQLISWSSKKNNALFQATYTKQKAGTEIIIKSTIQHFSFSIPFLDEASVENATHCALLLNHLGYSAAEITNRMQMLAPVAMRLELKKGFNNNTIINDAYNSDLSSLSPALDFLNNQNQHNNKILILSDIQQSGKSNDDLYQEVSNMVKNANINHFIGIGNAIGKYSGLFSHIKHNFYDSTETFLRNLNTLQFNNSAILIKGARSFGFERISRQLEQKVHETVMEINLNALIQNLNYYKTQLTKDCKIMAMVKAFSYGSGSYEIANILQYHKVHYLAVAYADEGVELRKNGIQLPIMVMNPEPQSYSTLIEHNLEPEIYSLRVLRNFISTIHDAGNDKYSIHIKLDTGMHRLGFMEDDLSELISILKSNNRLNVASVFSHLAASDDDNLKAFTIEQISKFNTMSSILAKELGYAIPKHILNSSGITRYPEAHFDMVRLGIGLYGISPDQNERHHLQEVATLKTTISQIKKIRKGESIGYNRAAFSEYNMTIATVGIGYADGFSRKLGNGHASVLINGELVPIVGNVCMDMCMVDITRINVSEGDDVIIFGNERPIYDFAKQMDTIPYEVLTSISQRVKRVYYYD